MDLKKTTLSDNITHLLSDFFDTLVSRNCHPEEVKMRWCSQIIDVFGLNISTKKLYEIRIKCEAAICQSNFNKHEELEFEYAALLSLMLDILSAKYSLNISRRVFLDIAQDIELEIEKSVQRLNDDVVTFFRKAKERNKKIYIVSDFYMGADFIKKLVKHHKVEHLIDAYFTSSDFLKTKRSGNLYEAVLDECNLDPSTTFMIGDNYHSDVEMSQRNGLYALHIPRDFSFYEKSLSLAKKTSLVKKSFRKPLKEKCFDFNWMVIPLFVFIARLHNRLVQDNVKNVVFLAREGEFLKELFDLYCQNFSAVEVKSHYMYASRRGTYLPSLHNLKDEKFQKLLGQYCDMSLRVFIESLGLTDFLPQLKSSLTEVDFEKSQPNFKDSFELAQLVNNDLFIEVYEKERLARKQYLASYVDSILGDDNIHLVDVGWRGSIQDNIQAALNRPVVGYYCGILRGASTSVNNRKYGLLFHEMEGEQYVDSLYNEFRASYEVFCSASHGSLIQYAPAPEFGILENNPSELALFKQRIRPLQLNLRALFKELSDVKANNAFSITELESALKPIYEKSLFFPKKSEMISFSKLEHYENFGLFDFSTFDGSSLSRVSYIKSLLANPKFTVGREWWKPLGFENNRCGFFKYPYFLIKKLMMSRL